MLIDFAKANGLPVTFELDGGFETSISGKWKDDTGDFENALNKTNVFNPITVEKNTGPAITKEADVRPGDILSEPAKGELSPHSAVIIAVMEPGQAGQGQKNDNGVYSAADGVATIGPDGKKDELKNIYNPASTDGYRADYIDWAN